MRRNKYGVAPATARTMDGIRFDSRAEMRRYQELLLAQRAGVITEVERQPEFILIAPFLSGGDKYRGVKYRGDFRYQENGETVVEDVKGHATEVYRIKKQLFLQRFPHIVFREIPAQRRKRKPR